MSRRPPTENRAEQNRNTLKQLVKLEGNKSCSDCKRNKHPRWASWNLGVFICIRCSGIHRGMGTHISRVKSVDLDSWTDEQLESMIKWGNTRANKYWEAKLAPGHVPAEAKIENFIRTKFESKRWTMEGPIPDPSTLDTEGDDDVPLSVVQEKARMERSASLKAAPAGPSTASRATRQAPSIDLFGDSTTSAPTRTSTGPPGPVAPQSRPEPRQTKPAESLLGLDFLGGAPAAVPGRPSSTPSSTSTAQSRPDLKQSILSLYASKPAAPPPQSQQSASSSFGGMQSPPLQSPPAQSAFGGMDDAFASLSFSQPVQQAPKPAPFAGLDFGAKSSNTSTSKPVTTSYGGGGSFFDTPASPPVQSKPVQPTRQASSGFSDFMSSTSPPTAKPNPPPVQAQGNNLFDLMGGDPAPSSAPIAQPAANTMSSYDNSAFNLSKPAPPPQTNAAQTAAKSPSINLSSNFDAWGSSNAWSDDKPTTSTTAATATASGDFGWGSSTTHDTGGFDQAKAAPHVSADEDFGGWSSASAVNPPVAKPAPKQSGFNAGNDDLFSNVWQ